MRAVLVNPVAAPVEIFRPLTATLVFSVTLPSSTGRCRPGLAARSSLPVA
jgi:hypothetical protein